MHLINEKTNAFNHTKLCRDCVCVDVYIVPYIMCLKNYMEAQKEKDEGECIKRRNFGVIYH